MKRFSLPLLSILILFVFFTTASANTWEDFEYSYLSDGTICIDKYTGNSDEVNIPDFIGSPTKIPITMIGESSFEKSDVKKVRISSERITLGKSAFYECRSLEEVIFSESVKDITIGTSDWGVFIMCLALKELTIPDTVTDLTINKAGFVFSGLEKIVIGSRNVSIGTYAFDTPVNLEEIVFTPNVRKIVLGTENEHLFFDTHMLKSITIPDTVESLTIRENALADIESLETVMIGSSHTTIDEMAFNNCSNLTTVTFTNPAADNQISDLAFSNCPKLEDIIYTESFEPSVQMYEPSDNVLADAQIDAYQMLYEQAKAILQAGNYDTAKLIFETIRDYSDSADMIKECEYQHALSLEAEGTYLDALTAFAKLEDYKDSSEHVVQNALKLQQFQDNSNNSSVQTEPTSMPKPIKAPTEIPAAQVDDQMNKISVNSAVNIYIETEEGQRAGYDWEIGKNFDEIPGVDISRSMVRSSVVLPNDLKYYLWMNYPETEEAQTFDVVITSPGRYLELTNIKETFSSPNFVYSPPTYYKGADMIFEAFEVMAYGDELPGIDFTITDEHGEYNFTFQTTMQNGKNKTPDTPVDFLVFHNYDEGEIGIWISALYEEEAKQFKKVVFDVTGEFTLWDNEKELHIEIPETNPITLNENGMFFFNYIDWQNGDGLMIRGDLDGNDSYETKRKLS